MTRWILCVLATAAVTAARADDPAQKLGRYRAEDDKKAAVPSPLAEDTEQIRHGYGGYHGGYGGGYRGYYGGGYRGYYAGYRYPSYYGGGYRGYYGGGLSFGFSSYYAPQYYAVPSYYAVPAYSYPSYYYGGFWGVNGTSGSGVTLNLSLKPNAASTATPPAVPTEPGFRYDGGPANLVPQPAPDKAAPKAAPTPEPEVVKIAVKKAEPKPVTRYKAYGEK